MMNLLYFESRLSNALQHLHTGSLDVRALSDCQPVQFNCKSVLSSNLINSIDMTQDCWMIEIVTSLDAVGTESLKQRGKKKRQMWEKECKPIFISI